MPAQHGELSGGGDERAATLATRSIKPSAKAWALDLASESVRGTSQDPDCLSLGVRYADHGGIVSVAEAVKRALNGRLAPSPSQLLAGFRAYAAPASATSRRTTPGAGPLWRAARNLEAAKNLEMRG